jgi:XTP/dITP diphosphohydrolase
MPGIFSARWAGRHGDDAANLDLLLAQLTDVPDNRRGAAFVCAAVYVDLSGHEVMCKEEMRGHLLREPRGTNGFGYDPIFVYGNGDRTTAEMTPEEKNGISHRGKAFRQLAHQLRVPLGGTMLA